MRREESTEGIYYTFDHSLWIRGVEWEDGCFTIADMYYENENDKGVGNGRKALKELKKRYKEIYVSDVTNESEEFWNKMKSETFIRDIVSYWD